MSKKQTVRRALLVVVVTAAAYASALWNKHALDDALVITDHIAVHRGLAGLGEIFGRDTYAGFFETVGMQPQLEGGRYRPLALATFALEQSLFGQTRGDQFRALTDPIARADFLENQLHADSLALVAIRHAVSLLLYLALVLALLHLLDCWIWPTDPIVALVATLLFALHPIHTEVVANLKSRDEILSLLFCIATLHFAFVDDKQPTPRSRLLALACLGLALLAKEYAVVLPLVAASALWIVNGTRPRALAKRWLGGVVVILGCYVGLRLSATGWVTATPLSSRDVLNDPFLPLRLGEANGSVLATTLGLLAYYPRLLVVPHPLSADYSYATFPFLSWSSPWVWLSIGGHGALLVATVAAIRRRHVLGLAGTIYFAFLLPVSNLIFAIGATLGERLVFHASLGFVLALAWAVARVANTKPLRVALLAAPIGVAYAVLVAARVPAWHDDSTLFLRDVETVPRSAMANGNAGAQLTQVALQRVRQRRLEQRALDTEDRRLIHDYTERARPYLERALAIHPRFANAAVNLGLLHWTRDEYAEAAAAWTRAAAIYPSHPVLRRYGTNFHVFGTEAARSGDLALAIRYYEYAAAIVPREPQFHRDLAGARFTAMRFAAARDAFDALLAAHPDDADAARGRAAADGLDRLERAAESPTATEADRVRFAEALASNAAPAFQARAAALKAGTTTGRQ